MEASGADVQARLSEMSLVAVTLLREALIILVNLCFSNQVLATLLQKCFHTDKQLVKLSALAIFRYNNKCNSDDKREN